MLNNMSHISCLLSIDHYGIIGCILVCTTTIIQLDNMFSIALLLTIIHGNDYPKKESAHKQWM